MTRITMKPFGRNRCALLRSSVELQKVQVDNWRKHRGAKIMGLGFNPKKLKGGRITGPGTGTSDSIDALAEEGSFIMPADSTQALELPPQGDSPERIAQNAQGFGVQGLGENVPIKVSNGETMFTPEEIYQIGLAVLRQQSDATHVPVPEKQQGFGFHPQAFANSGVVGRNKTSLGEKLDEWTGLGVTGQLFDNELANIKKNWKKGNVAGAASNFVRAGLGAPGTFAIDAVRKGEPLVRFGKGLLGIEDDPEPQATPRIETITPAQGIKAAPTPATTPASVPNFMATSWQTKPTDAAVPAQGGGKAPGSPYDPAGIEASNRANEIRQQTIDRLGASQGRGLMSIGDPNAERNARVQAEAAAGRLKLDSRDAAAYTQNAQNDFQKQQALNAQQQATLREQDLRNRESQQRFGFDRQRNALEERRLNNQEAEQGRRLNLLEGAASQENELQQYRINEAARQDDLLRFIASPEFTKLSREDQEVYLQRVGIAPQRKAQSPIIVPRDSSVIDPVTGKEIYMNGYGYKKQ
jgi:hypothetical protein